MLHSLSPISSPWGWHKVSELPFKRESIPTLMLSVQCDGLCCSLPLPSSPSTFSCTAAFWTRSWRNLSWIYQGQRGKALLCFATLPTLIHNPSQQALAPGQDRGAQAAIPAAAVGCSLQHREPSTEQSALCQLHKHQRCAELCWGRHFPQPLASQPTGML